MTKTQIKVGKWFHFVWPVWANFMGVYKSRMDLKNKLFGPCFGVKSSVSPLFQALVRNGEDSGLRKQLHNILLNQFRTCGASADSELPWLSWMRAETSSHLFCSIRWILYSLLTMRLQAVFTGAFHCTSKLHRYVEKSENTFGRMAPYGLIRSQCIPLENWRGWFEFSFVQKARCGRRLQSRVLWVITQCRGWWGTDCIAQNISNWPFCTLTHEARLSPQNKSLHLLKRRLNSFQRYLKSKCDTIQLKFQALEDGERERKKSMFQK